MEKDFRVAVLISGQGSNMRRIIESSTNYRVTLVLSDNPKAPGLSIATGLGVPCQAFDRSAFSSKREMKQALFGALLQAQPDLLCLAGFMQIVDAEIVQALAGRIINIHPSLLPQFPGLKTHERAIQSGVTVHGCTVHFVDTGVDTGPIIAQAKVEVSSQDTPETLAQRVLSREHQLYPWVVRKIAAGNVWFESGHTAFQPNIVEEAISLGFTLGAVK